MFKYVRFLVGLLIVYISVLECDCFFSQRQLDATDSPQYITSSPDSNCEYTNIPGDWEIQGPSGSRIQIAVLWSQIDNDGSCRSGDHVQVYDGERYSEDSRLLEVFCGTQTPTFESESSAVNIKLSSGYSCDNSFRLEYKAIIKESSSNSGWGLGWKEMLIFVGCAAFMCLIFHIIIRFRKAKEQRRRDLEMGGNLTSHPETDNTAVSSHPVPENQYMESNTNDTQNMSSSISDAPPSYDDVMKKGIEAPPNYSATAIGEPPT